MSEWHAPIASFAKTNGYAFSGDLAFCTVKAKTRATTVDLWISKMGPGRPRATLAGALSDLGVVHCRGKAKLAASLDVEVRRKTLLDRIFSRGAPVGRPDFDSKYVAIGKEEDLRRLLTAEAVDAFVAMWSRTEGLQIEDREVTVQGGGFSFDPAEVAFIIDTLAAIASAGET